MCASCTDTLWQMGNMLCLPPLGSYETAHSPFFLVCPGLVSISALTSRVSCLANLIDIKKTMMAMTFGDVDDADVAIFTYAMRICDYILLRIQFNTSIPINKV